MNRSLTASVSALALLLAAGAAQAGPMPENVQWTYNFAPGAPAVFADGNPSAGVTFTNEPNKVAVGNSNIVATNLRAFSASTADAPDTISGNYSLGLDVSTRGSDNQVHSARLTFTGQLTGTFSAEHSDIENTFLGDVTQSVVLGEYSFTVTMISATLPGPPDQQNAGSFAARVTVEKAVIAETPEPSALLLSGLAVTFLGGAAWRKRRQARQSA